MRMVEYDEVLITLFQIPVPSRCSVQILQYLALIIEDHMEELKKRQTTGPTAQP